MILKNYIAIQNLHVLFISGKYFSLLRIASLPLRETLFVTDLFFSNHTFLEHLFGLWSNL